MLRLAHVPWLLFRRDGAIDPSLKLELKGPADANIDGCAVQCWTRLDKKQGGLEDEEERVLTSHACMHACIHTCTHTSIHTHVRACVRAL